ncbi:MAG: hypothetical protein P4L55_10090 [Syntrophobacteraceae bacterium]|nr:hypothetical protein [Syntrophobacteraceae bacterium]
MPLSGCGIVLNPCSAEDACTPVSYTTVPGAQSCVLEKTTPPSDYLRKVPQTGVPEGGEPREELNKNDS